MKPFRIALIGDEITASWDKCDELITELDRVFPRSPFEVVNHALPHCRSGHALWCLTHDYQDSAGVRHECVTNGAFDLIIIESFAYTDSEDDAEGLTEYRDILRRIWEEIERSTTAKRLFYVAQPPERDRYGENARHYRNVSKATRARHADRVKLYLQEAQRIAADEGWPVADALAEVEKKLEAGDRLRRYINQADGITPSRYGFECAGRVIARAIDLHRMMESE